MKRLIIKLLFRKEIGRLRANRQSAYNNKEFCMRDTDRHYWRGEYQAYSRVLRLLVGRE